MKNKRYDKSMKIVNFTDYGDNYVNENIEMLNTIASIINDPSFTGNLQQLISNLTPMVKNKLKQLLNNVDEWSRSGVDQGF